MEDERAGPREKAYRWVYRRIMPSLLDPNPVHVGRHGGVASAPSAMGACGWGSAKCARTANRSEPEAARVVVVLNPPATQSVTSRGKAALRVELGRMA